MLKRFIHAIVIAFILFIYSPFLFSQLIKDTPVNILFIGNSYTHMNNMPKIFNDISKYNNKNVHVEMNTKSNSSFKIHSTRLDMYESIKSKKWDFIILQGFSREFSFSKSYIDTASLPYFDRILDSIYKYHPCVNLLLYNTWGYKYGVSYRDEINDYAKMQDSVIKGYEYVSDSYNIPIVPVGMVWRNIYKSNPKINLYHKDNQHPSFYGSYLSACTFYTSIFQEYPESNYSLRNKKANIIQNEAFSFVIKNYDNLNLLQNRSFIDYYRTANFKYLLEGNANYPNASSFKWYFGDGKSSISTNPIHRYRRAGKYKLKLIVEDECGTREYTKTVTFVKPKKPKRPKLSLPRIRRENKKI
jgi:hypothetical protein